MDLNGDTARDLSRKLIDTYFRTVTYPYTRHHIDSYDQFVQEDLVNIIRSQNPIVILKDLIDENTSTYKYRVEIYVGGETGNEIEIGTPTLYHQLQDETRILFPNEARLRNLTYASTVYANIVVKIQYVTATREVKDLSLPKDTFTKWPLFRLPIMLHSQFCILHNKPKEFLREAGECPYDHGGYFIIDGAEKVLVTRQEQAFNTLYITPQNDPKISVYASIECLSAKTRQSKRVAFALMRYVEPTPGGFGAPGSKLIKQAAIRVSLPFVRKPIPLFVLFRALGFQSDEEILHMIFPDFNQSEAKLLLPKLHPSILDAFPFLNSFTAVQYIKSLTKGFSEAHVLDIIRNQLFIHMPNDPASQGLFLGDCVRRILRVNEGYDNKTDRDDTRNQRCLTSGFLIQELFNNSYKLWIKAFALTIDKEYNYNKGTIYKDEQFQHIFDSQNANRIFMAGLLNDMISKGFRGKWGTGLGEEKTGVLQAMSRLSYVDFLSHCRRVILNFDTSMKLTGPRKLHTSQYGYYCTSETPTGASIGITKNLSIFTAISISSQTGPFFTWLRTTGRVFSPEDLTTEHRIHLVPVYINGGMFGYTDKPDLLTKVLKYMKRTACLPYSVSITFSIRDRKVYLYMDAGRPLRPLICLSGNKEEKLPLRKLLGLKTWRDLVLGTLDSRKQVPISNVHFFDPLQGKGAKLENYNDYLEPHTGAIEYIDPYEQNETFIANNPAYIRTETTHMEVHPSTIMSMMTSLIPFAPHNQSPRNQLSCSQSKQGLSIYATNWRNRFDNTAHVLCYGEMPLTRTIYNNYLGEGKMAYGMNCILAIACWSGYNQEDGIVMNMDAIQRGMFRSMAFRSYEAFEEDDEKAGVRVRFGHPASIATWKDLRPGLDYSKLDERGIIREGEYVDENTVLVGAYMSNIAGGQVTDASKTPQVWTSGRVEKVVVMVNNSGLRLVKIRVVQDRIPELGDKFCMSDDHLVKTAAGWKPIAEITTDDFVAQLDPSTNEIQFTRPIATHVFHHTDNMYLLQTPYGSHYITAEHRVYGRWLDEKDRAPLFEFVRASVLYTLYRQNDIHPDPTFHGFVILNEFGEETPVISIGHTPTNVIGNKVYCLSVPTEIFLARRKDESVGYWTGNSNRHGQKGTIGALLRGYDMPRTESGIVPDMIMNPHAIPSRMTIAQNLEQLLGKTAALTGAIGDGTSFMNDGSPQEAIGSILEQIGYEKYGNEVLYNGATGEQLEAAIFIGPVYGMRLKHMVEDKWNARGKGRKEVRTHQPTGGRGAQGGLKIGEMDRDAIIAHAGMSFVKESYMERSDGTTISVCTSCGLVPIYNPRLNIRMCPSCDGPVRYAGDTVNTLELLPPLSRPKGNIVQVEMPYSTKLLMQEQETYLNIATRLITTRGVQQLTPFERSGQSSEVIRELPRLIQPSAIASAYVPETDKVAMTLEQMRSLKAALEEKKAELDVIIEESNQNVAAAAQVQDENGAIVNVPIASVPMAIVPVQGTAPLAPIPLRPDISTQMLSENQVILPQQQQPLEQPQMGGLMVPGGQPTYVGGSSMGPIIVVDTGGARMQQELGGLQGIGGMGRAPRRNPFRRTMDYGGDMGSMGSMGSFDSMNSMDNASSPSVNVRVNKMG
jgi:DNA-directed RNA polymerase II subunit RPB2